MTAWTDDTNLEAGAENNSNKIMYTVWWKVLDYLEVKLTNVKKAFNF